MNEWNDSRGRHAWQVAAAAVVLLAAAAWAPPVSAGDAPGSVGVTTVRSLVIDPHEPGTLYAGADCNGVAKSTDGGITWQAASTDLFRGVGALAIDPADPSTLYAGAFPSGVYKSTDGGNTWHAANSGLPESFVASLAIDPATPSTLYAGTRESRGGVFKSTDGGSTWIDTLPALGSAAVYALAIDPLTPSTLYAGTGGGAWKTTTGGTTWSFIGLGRGTNVLALAIDPLTPDTLYAGTDGRVLRSRNGGATWTPVNDDTLGAIPYVFALTIDPVSPGTLYAGTWTLPSGVFKSTNRGDSWSAAETGVGSSVYALVIDPDTPSTLYAGAEAGGVFKSTDGGDTWAPIGLGETICGDGLRCGPEECDDGNSINGDACDSNCTMPRCGNGIVTAGEECDNGGDAFDGCTYDCTICGNRIVTPPEQCDDGNRDGNDACTNACLQNVCRDGFLDSATEECDDGNFSSGDGCDSNCTATRCGNGIATLPEECDDGNRSNNDRCTNACLRTFCGDRFVNPASEQCEDGNLVDGDGCDANCTFTACGNGIVTAGEQCDDGNRGPYDGCTANCTICGDGVVTPPEDCDDRNTNSFDGCTSSCTRCGNGIATPPERCDDRNLLNGDGCDADCIGPVCGDGRVDEGEDCDAAGICVGGADAGTLCTSQQCPGGTCQIFGGDGCAANCTAETAHRLELDPEASQISFQPGFSTIPVQVSGGITLRLGESADSEAVPVVVRAEDIRFAPIPIYDSCVCIRGVEDATLGEGVSGTGSISCAGGFPGIDVLSSIDHNTNDIDPSCAAGFPDAHADVCRGPVEVEFSGRGPAGSMRLELRLESWSISDAGTCAIDAGGDGIPCTGDDPGREASPGLQQRSVGSRGPAGGGVIDPGPIYVDPLPSEFELRLTTGKASAEILDANNTPGQRIAAGVDCYDRTCVTEAEGTPLSCAALAQGTVDAELVGAVVNLDTPSFGDLVATFALSPPPLCAGDCHGDGRVGIDELVTLVRIGLRDAVVSACDLGDVNHDGEVSIDEIITAVSFALAGCR